MKYILESPEVFEAYAIIDCCYCLLKEAYKKLSAPKDGLQIMIDKATGYDKSQVEQAKKEIMDLLEQVIEAKKTIGADYKNDEKALTGINKHL